MAKKIIKKILKKIKKAAPKKPSAKKPAKKTVKKPVKKEIKKVSAVSGEELTKDEIKEIKKHLIELREDALARLKEKKDTEMPEDAAYGDPIDVATQSLDKEILFEQADNSQTTIDQIESALRKIDKGIYGKCEYCRAALPKKRIKALPFARYCVNCQSSHEGGI